MGFELPFVIGPEYIAVALFGVVIGIIFGAIPGMTATMAVAVFLPLTYAYSCLLYTSPSPRDCS